MPKNYLSKITLPSGNSVFIKDTEAREMIAGGISFVVCWDGTSEPVVANIPAGVKVQYDGTTYTGTMSAASAQPMTFYLIKSSTQESENDYYDEYVVVKLGAGTEQDPYVYSWEKLGDTRIDLSDLGALAYKNDVVLSKGSGDSVLGADTTIEAAASEVSFQSGAGSDFVTGYNNDAVAPTFQEGAFTPASLGEGFVSNGTAPSFQEGAFTPAAIESGFVTPGVAAELQSGFYSEGTAPSLGNSTKSAFAVEGMVAAMGTGDEAETLIFSAASTSNAVTEQGTFSAGTPTTLDLTKFNGGTPTAVDTSKFSGGSKAADTFSAGTMTSVDVTKFNGGSKASDTFNAGSAATLATAKALTAAVTGTAAAQAITVGNDDLVSVAKYDDLSVSAE